ncbi:MAG: cache domain-containing protein [Campylobacterota bacterium]|nr:cache domain-containing protein [Campylobacterota bacterium]
MNNENTFLKIIAYTPLVIIPLLVGILSFAYINSYNASFKKNLSSIKENIYNLEKKALKTKVDNASDIIVYRQSVIKKELEDRVKNRVLQAHKIAKYIYENSKDKRLEAEIKNDIVTALKPFLWNNGESFIWIIDYDGVMQLAPDYLKHLTHTSILNLQDATGRYVIKEEIEICKNKGEGFLWDTFTKPNADTDKQYEQVAFVKALGQYNWYLGSSEYLDTATKSSNKKLIESLRNIDIVDNNYLFMVDTDGKILINKTIPEYLGKNIREIDHNLTISTVKNFISSMQDKESTYLTYKWLSTATNSIEDKHAYIRKIPNTNWILGSGFYFSEVEKHILKKTLNINDGVSSSKTILAILLFSILVSFLVALLISRKLKEKFSDYKKTIDKRGLELEELNSSLEKKVAQRTEQLKELAIKDELTKLYNRKYYNEKIESFISLYNRYNTPFSVIMYDIDDFKQINDTYGHKPGDTVLIEMSERIQSIIRKDDILCRVGGEEFIILVHKATIDNSFALAEKIRQTIEESEMIQAQKITISIGVTEVKEGDTEDSIFQRVDGLLYYSKAHGKNRVSTKTIGDLSYSYYIDDEASILYERIQGTYMNLNAFVNTLMDEAYMIRYLECENIITDFTDLEMNFEHYQHEVLELFEQYKHFYVKHQKAHLKNKKSASLIYKFDNVDSVEPFRTLQRSYGVETQNFKKINEISQFIGRDVQKYFNMADSELTVHE